MFYGKVFTFWRRFFVALIPEYSSKLDPSFTGFTTTGFHTASGVQEEMDRVPKFMVFPASRIANEGVEAMFDGKRIFIPTKTYRTLVYLTSNLPQSLLRFISKLLAPGRYDRD